MPVDRALSKLMTEAHAKAYDDLEAQFTKVEIGLPHLWARSEVKDLTNRLAALKQQMERPRYLVGLLGRSQVGKSTVLNSVLNAPTGQGPASSGADCAADHK